MVQWEYLWDARNGKKVRHKKSGRVRKRRSFPSRSMVTPSAASLLFFCSVSRFFSFSVFFRMRARSDLPWIWRGGVPSAGGKGFFPPCFFSPLLFFFTEREKFFF